MRGVQTLIRIVTSGKHKDMVRYALGALRNLANDAPIQRQLVDEVGVETGGDEAESDKGFETLTGGTK